jgi:hypothetical protein
VYLDERPATVELGDQRADVDHADHLHHSQPQGST